MVQMAKVWTWTVTIIMVLTPLVWAWAIGRVFVSLGWSHGLGVLIGLFLSGAAIVTVLDQPGRRRREPLYPIRFVYPDD